MNVDSKMSFERGGTIPTVSEQPSTQEGAINSPPSTKSQIVQLNSKEREFNRMLTRVTKTDPLVINSADTDSTPPPQELEHITNKGDCALDMIYPPLV